MPNPLIEPDELAARLNDPQLAIIDCRFDLAAPDLGEVQYLTSHIPGAVYAHLDKALSGPPTPTNRGRHPLPARDVLKHNFTTWGISRTTQVVAYDASGGMVAARLWWLLRWFGHTHVAVLNGGWPAWLAAGYPTRTGRERRQPYPFAGDPNPAWLATAADVDALRQNPVARVIDARAPDRFAGQNETLDPLAGHIPGARNRFWQANLAPDGKFLPPAELKTAFTQLLREAEPQDTVFYCGSGVSAAHHVLAQAIAGLPLGRIYDGSWSDWITRPGLPIHNPSEDKNP